MSPAPDALPEGVEIDELLAGLPCDPGDRRRSLVPLLLAVQERHGYLPADALDRAALATGTGLADVYGVASFYAQLRLRPAGRHRIRVCVGTACYVRGAEAVADAFCAALRIPEGDDTDPDREFTVERVACLGCCSLAPAVRVGDLTYGPVEPLEVERVLRDFRAGLGGVKSRGVEGPRPGPAGGEVRTCLCSGCAAAGAGEVRQAVQRGVRSLGLPVRVGDVGCSGFSHQSPFLEVRSPGEGRFRYGRLRPDDVAAMLRRHFRPTGLLRRAGAQLTVALDRLLTDEAWEPVTRYLLDVRDAPREDGAPLERHLAIEHAGEASPLDLDDYRARGGFAALRRCLLELTPEQVLEEIAASGLRGRGGAGFPTGEKWGAVAAADVPRIVVCNGDEGDPGAFMDRLLLESFPLRVIEGVAIAARAVGAESGVIYVRGEYPTAVDRVRRALELCFQHGYLGDDILGSGQSLHLDLAVGAGAFVCGEETALLAALEGGRGAPRLRPPYPSERGLGGRPTLVNNVETFALVPWVLRRGAAAFAAIGTAESPGTKTFALAGKVARGGLVEVPMGTSLRRIVQDIGGGTPDGRPVKAVHVGGPAGGLVPAARLETPVDYRALKESGAILGSGGLVVLDESDCAADFARYFLEFACRESCGKCTFCRVGTRRLLETLEALCAGACTRERLAEMERLAASVQRSSLCGLGRSAPNAVLTALRHFREELEAHTEGRCPALRCRPLIRFEIDRTCIGCTRCAQACPADAIPPDPYHRHVVDPEACVRCGGCRRVCPAGAVQVRTGPSLVEA